MRRSSRAGRAEKDATTSSTSACTTQLTKTASWRANPHRQTLGVPPLDDLTATTSLSDGWRRPRGQPGAACAQGPALADIATMKVALDTLAGDGFAEKAAALLAGSKASRPIPPW